MFFQIYGEIKVQQKQPERIKKRLNLHYDKIKSTGMYI